MPYSRDFRITLVWVVGLLALGSLIPWALPAQEPEATADDVADSEVTEVVADLERRHAEIAESVLQIDGTSNRAAAAMLERDLARRWVRFRDDLSELVRLVAATTDLDADLADARDAAGRFLKEDADRLRAKAAEANHRTADLLEVIEVGDAEEVREAREELVARLPRDDRLFSALGENLEQQSQLGLEVAHEVSQFVKVLQLRAAVGAGALDRASSMVEHLDRRPGADKDAQLQKQLTELREIRNQIAESQRHTVVLLENHGVDTAELKQDIILATGRVSEDILDREVAVGLVQAWFRHVGEWFRDNGGTILVRCLLFASVLLVSWLLAWLSRAVTRRTIKRHGMSRLARDIVIGLSGRLILILGFIVALTQLGLQVGPLLAGLGIAGFIIGFALQDTLSNFASGLMILLYTPFDVGDTVEAAGVRGKIHQMNLVSTTFLTFDNQLLLVPNKEIWGGIIRNVSFQETRRVDLKFTVAHADEVDKAEAIFLEILAHHEKVLSDPAPVVHLHELGESSVVFVARPWVRREDYWEVYWDVTREVKRRFEEERLSIPMSRHEVSLRQPQDEESKR